MVRNKLTPSRLRKAGITTAAGALAISITIGFEGLRTRAYIPIPGDVPTICVGHTKGVKLGDSATPAECKAMLVDDLIEYEAGMRACLKAPDALKDKSYIAFLTFTYNLGPPTFCRGSVARKINDGDVRGACDALLLYDKAKGKTIPGLTRRRREERALCLEGLV